jgi:hypothetical protein
VENNFSAKTFENIILIGGPMSNKVTQKIISNEEILSRHFQASFPVKFTSPWDKTIDEQSEAYVEEFSIGDYFFNDKSNSLLFTFPIKYDSSDIKKLNFPKQHNNWMYESKSRLGALILANRHTGFLSLTRLVSPTIPPMVRSPFANYQPDYMVINEKIWESGFGSVQMAGFWDSYWNFSRDVSYVNANIL